MSENNRDRFFSLMAEYGGLDPAQNSVRAGEILSEAATLVDAAAEPKKWATLRGMYGKCTEEIDPESALAAYRDALTVWEKDGDRDIWMTCHGAVGYLLTCIEPVGPAQMDEAISHLEAAVEDQPFWAALLSVLYRFRVNGDPYENWKKRIHYVEMVLSGVVREEDPKGWARVQNDLGEAYGDEPDADFIPTLERRIGCHEAALKALGEVKDETWIETALFLSECLLFRGPDRVGEHLAAAEKYARDALALCDGARKDLRAKALLTLGKVLVAAKRRPDAAALGEAMSLFDEAAGWIDPVATPALAATVESLRANVCLKQISLGEAVSADTLLSHADAALGLLAGEEHLRDRRCILQVAGEGLLALGDFHRGRDYLARAVAAADTALAQAGSLAGRMERIWEFRDSSALLSYCLVRLGRTDEALVALDRGKARFWQEKENPWTPEELSSLVPPGGALLFPDFAAREGVVVAVTGSGSRVIFLPGFGQARLMELQRGGEEAEELGGWLKAYALRNSEHPAWRAEIDRMGRVLWEEVWAPVLAALVELGIHTGADLVWFPQGGSGIFPLHAAWRLEEGQRRWLLEDYTVRYAPSVRALLSGERRNPPASDAALVVANPTLDLVFSELECAWVSRSLRNQKMEMLHGEAASPEAVRTALACANIIHFSSHAVFDINRPLDSFLLMAGGQRLTIGELLPIITHQAFRLVVLSACETGMARTTVTPDEFLGFPAAFLHAGTGSVLATLWPVDDAASAILIGRFYLEWCTQGKPPAVALQDAQNWLRRVTVRELLDLLRDLKDEPSPAGPLAARCRTLLRGIAPDSTPFAEPYFWAAFTLFGKE